MCIMISAMYRLILDGSLSTAYNRSGVAIEKIIWHILYT